MLGTIQLGGKILNREGHKLGKVKGLVANADSGRLTHLVVENYSWDYCKKVVGAEEIKILSADGTQLQLGLSSKEFEALPDFTEQDYSETDYSGAPYFLLSSGAFSPWLFGRGYLPPLPEAISTPEGGTLVKQAFVEKVNVPTGSLVIQEGADVITQDGKNIGYLKRVNLELYTGIIKTLKVSRGFPFQEMITVALNTVLKVTDYSIKLGLTKAQLR